MAEANADSELVEPLPYDLNRLRKENYKKVPELKMVLREGWEAKAPQEGLPGLQLPVKEVLMVYTETDPCNDDDSCIKAVQDIQRDQMAQGALDIHWNFLVGGNGKIYEGRGWLANAQKCSKYAELDGTTLDIAYIAKAKKEVTEDMKFMKGQLIRLGLWEFVIAEPFNFIEDKVDKTKIVARNKKYEEKRRMMRKKMKKKKGSCGPEEGDFCLY